MLMAPLVRRTWSPQGQTPIFYQRTSSHKKVSVIAALCVAPGRAKLHFYFRLHPDANINAELVRDFLRHLLRQLNGPALIVWDRLPAHRSKMVQTFIQATPYLYAFFLPPYAPELNPVEYVWSYLKMNPLANRSFFEVNSLAKVTRSHVRSLQRKPNLLRAFMEHSPLSLRLK